MKVQCDVCNTEEASVFCCAEEAALCGTCDRRVHCANKLASQHHRLSLVNPNSNSSNAPPLCDICQEKRAFLFCQEDRAILCRDCDGAVHNASHLTAKHTRFLLTGVKLSAEKSETLTDTSSRNNRIDETKMEKEDIICCTNNSSSSSISEYLMEETLPGWHVGDFLFDHQMDEALSFTESSYGFAEDHLPLWSYSSGTSESSGYDEGHNKNQSGGGGGGKANRKLQRSKDVYTVPLFQDESNN